MLFRFGDLFYKKYGVVVGILLWILLSVVDIVLFRSFYFERILRWFFENVVEVLIWRLYFVKMVYCFLWYRLFFKLVDIVWF